MDRIIEFVGNHPFLTGGFVAVLILLLKAELGARFSKWKSVGTTDATRLINHEDALILDIRPNNEYSDGHIVNCKHVPMSELSKRLGDLEKYRDKPIIAYCRSGSRSVAACQLLTKEGFEKVYNLSGGIMAWESANLPVSKR